MTNRMASRWEPLDVLRGLAVAGMILVTSPGDWNHAYAQLRHAEWEGWTLADMVFPTFLFSVGVALGLSFPKRLDAPGARVRLWGRIARRALALIAIGLVLNWLMELGGAYWYSDPGAGTFGHVRIPGILQRIALCYLLAAALLLATGVRERSGATRVNAAAVGVAIAVLLLGYWALLVLVPVPGEGAGHLDAVRNLPGYIDRLVFTPPHLWRLGSERWGGPVTYDPEGLLSTLPATANLFFGVLAAREWQRQPARTAWRLAIGGVLLLAAGLLLGGLLPINKRLWTSSFALLSSGFSALMLAGLAVALRAPAAQRLATPLRVLGGNAILAFVLSILLGVFSQLPILGDPGARITPQKWGNDLALSLIPNPNLASLACALAILVLITALLWPLHRRAIHFRL
jgi:predicted acyltransferase